MYRYTNNVDKEFFTIRINKCVGTPTKNNIFA